MSSRSPQNPVFQVNPAALDVCLPKVVCAQCGTVISVRRERPHVRVRCPNCHCYMVGQEEEPAADEGETPQKTPVEEA